MGRFRKSRKYQGKELYQKKYVPNCMGRHGNTLLIKVGKVIMSKWEDPHYYVHPASPFWATRLPTLNQSQQIHKNDV